MKIGYIRVSTEDQNMIRQEVLLESLEVERVYMDKTSGKNTDRAQLRELLTFVREGDTVVVESISRFARNTRDLLELVESLTQKGVTFVSQKEAIDTGTPTGQFMLTVFGAVAELERAALLERQREGIVQAKKAGKYKGRKPVTVDAVKWEAVCRLWQSGQITAVEAQRRLGLGASTFYRRLRQENRSKSPL